MIGTAVRNSCPCLQAENAASCAATEPGVSHSCSFRLFADGREDLRPEGWIASILGGA
jgi:hypothetical protein